MAWRPCLAGLAVTVVTGVTGAGAAGTSGPLCHGSFKALEACLGHDHQRIKSHCATQYAALRSCLDTEWLTLDAAGAYEKPPNAFNRLKPCRHGLMLYNPLDWYIGRSLEVYGEWAEKKVQLWARFLQPGHVVVDVGAHIGALTLPLSKLVGATGRVVAIEAFGPSFTTLAANTGLNSLENVEVMRAVVAQKAGKIRMDRGMLAFKQHDFFNFGSMDFHGLNILASDTADAPAPATHWDDYAVMKLDSLSLGRLDFLKIDAEQMEQNVLKGASGLISKFKPLIFVEYRNPKQTKSRLLQLIRKMQYECVLVRLPIFNQQNFRQHREDIWSSGSPASIMNFNLFCRSTQQDYPHLGDVAVLFSSAVETDVAGLRSTPLPDPFEVIAKYAKSSRVKRRDVTSTKPQKKVPPATQKAGVAAMSMEELLDLVDPSGAAPRASADSDAGAVTLEELLESVNNTEEQTSTAAFPAETTLDEL